MSLRTAVPLALGGALGTLARYGLLRAWPAHPGSFPWAVLLINASGSFALGILIAAASGGSARARWARLVLGTGVVGAFTTFSTFAVGLAELLRAGRVLVAAADLAGSLAAGLAAGGLGLALARRRLAARQTAASGTRRAVDGAPALAPATPGAPARDRS